jgi:hypothetical protein
MGRKVVIANDNRRPTEAFIKKMMKELIAKGPFYRKKWAKDNPDATPSDFFDHQIKAAWAAEKEKHK